ncbi:MAG: DUF1858 domain-containing protein [Alsobacter sp.]
MPSITEDLLVDDVMRLWPETIRVFLNYRFGCIGCPIGSFHTVREACHEHQVEVGGFLSALRNAAGHHEGEADNVAGSASAITSRSP